MKSRARGHLRRRGKDLTPSPSTTEAKRRDGPPGCADSHGDGDRQEQADQQQHWHRVAHQANQGPRSGLDGAAKEVRRIGRGAAGGDGRFEPPPFRPLNRAGPMPLCGSRRTVEEGLWRPQRPSNAPTGIGLAPPTLRSGWSRRLARVRRGPRVSSQPTPCWAEPPRCSASVKKLACEPAAGYTTGRRPSTSSSLSSPQSARSALMLAVADSDRRLVEGFTRVLRVEHELDQLPVTLVEVVPVVVDIEEPVLERELSRVRRIGGHVRIRRVLPALMRRPQRS